MTNTELLNEKIRISGLKKSYLAEKLGLTRSGFWNYVNNKSQFKADHIKILCDELNITSLKEKESIFFAKIGA